MQAFAKINVHKIKLLYALALGFVALMLIVSSLLLQGVIQTEKDDSRIINLSGRQRMLSQRLTKCVLALGKFHESKSGDRYVEELRQALTDWTAAQAGLQFGDSRLGLPDRENSPEIKELFTRITPYHERMVASATALLQAADANALTPGFLEETAASMLADEPHFLSLMDEITFRFDEEASNRISVLQRMETVVLGCGLLVLLLEYLSVFRPTVGNLTRMLDSLRKQGGRLKESNQKLQETLEEKIRLVELAKAADRAKSDFLARMSHEIRTPLNAVIGMCHLALKTELTPRQEDYLYKIRISSDMLLRVINDILDFSKIEAGLLTIERVPFDLEEVLGDVVSITSLGAAEKQLEFLLSVESDVPTGLVGDPLRLGQVLFNLVGNAIKFTEAGEVVLEVRKEDSGDAGSRLRFAVRDTGIGLSDQQLDHLFSPFSQADESISRRYGGTGLGLSICHRLVELMGGSLEVASTPGKGSEFFFSLDMPLSDIPVQAPRAEAVGLAGMKVLVVDDNATSRQIMSDMLLSMRFSVTVADGCRAALSLLEQEGARFPIILLDWKMPAMDGTECARRIRAMNLPRQPAIIMVTAYGREEIRINAENTGVNAFLLKPVHRSVLFDTIIDAVGLDHIPRCRPRSDGPEKGAMAGNLRGALVLLVEDNEINQQVAREVIEGAGMEVDVADHGEEALRLVGQKKYAAVLMDVQMPVMDGLEATRRLRADPRFASLPIIAMTAHALRQDREESIKAGMNDHVSKPIVPGELFAAMARWITPQEGSCAAVPADRPPARNSLQPGNEKSDAPALLDTHLGLSRVRGNKSLYNRLLRDFPGKFGQSCEKIQQALATGDPAGARRLAHTLKGVAGNIGAMALYGEARELESCLRQPEGDCQGLIDRCQDGVTRLLERIRELLPSGVGPEGAEAGKTGTPAPPTPSDGELEGLEPFLDLLSQNDTLALSLYDQLAEPLGRLDPEGAEALGAALRQFNFREARRIGKSFREFLKGEEGNRES